MSQRHRKCQIPVQVPKELRLPDPFYSPVKAFLFTFHWLCYYISLIREFFPLCATQPSTPHSLGQTPHYCSCPLFIRISSLASPFPILYFTSQWLFCNHLFVLLNLLTSSPSLPTPPLPFGNHQNALHIHDSVTVLVCLVCFLDSFVDRYVFFVILLFIVLMFF